MSLDGPILLLKDNKNMILNTTISSSILIKKHNAYAYHRVRESIAISILVFKYINLLQNFSDILIKLVDKATFYTLDKKILFRQPKVTYNALR